MEIDPATGEPVWGLPFEFLNVGESFFVPTLKPAHMMYVIDRRSKDAKIRVKSYVTTKDGYLGVRVWRLT